MTRHRRSLTWMLALAALSVPAAGLAQTKTGTAAATFLQIEPSARIAGMGNAGSALEGGLDAAWFNPGAVATLEGWQVQLDHAAWLADIAYDYVAVGLPLANWGCG